MAAISDFQTKEEQLFGNKEHGDSMEEFLALIGERVPLKDFPGWVNLLHCVSNQSLCHWRQKVNLTILVSDALKNLFHSINRNCESIICIGYVLELVSEYYFSQLILCCTVRKSQNM